MSTEVNFCDMKGENITSAELPYISVGDILSVDNSHVIQDYFVEKKHWHEKALADFRKYDYTKWKVMKVEHEVRRFEKDTAGITWAYCKEITPKKDKLIKKVISK